MRYTVSKNTVKIESNNKAKYFEFFSNKIVRIFTQKCPEDLFELQKLEPSYRFDIDLYEDNSNPEIVINSSNFSVRVDRELNVSILRDTRCFFKENKDKKEGLSLNLEISDDSRVFGLGDKMTTLDKKGYYYSSWNTDTSEHHDELFPSLYKTSNFLLNYSFNNFYGIYFPSTFRYNFDIAKTDINNINITSEKATLDYYLFLSEDIKDIVSNFSYLCGHPYLVRIKNLGNNQSRWSYENEDQVRDVAMKFREFDIPLDYIHLDIHYLNNYKILEVDKQRFPNMKQLSSDLKKDGVELIAINDAAVKVEEGYSLYDELISRGLASSLDGKPYVNTVWPGDSIFPNYFNPETQDIIYKYMSTFIEENGFSGIWNDMNEPASFKGELPLDVDMSFKNRKLSHEEAHNLYGEKMAECSYRYFVNNKRRPYVFSRAGFATTPKYAFFWNGDNFSLWHHLRYSIPQSLSLGLSNFMFNGDDVGGFGGDCNKQLLIRWTEANILFPFFRNHSSLNTKFQEPYNIDSETVEIYSKYIKLRYKLLPYLYDCCREMASKGQPITRPLFYNYPEDVRCLDINDQYMVGDSILVAPILDKDKKSRITYFPKGTWINYFTGEVYQGNQEVILPLELDELGLFIKSNSIIPMYKNMKFIDKKTIDTLILRIYGVEGQVEIYEDDGDSIDYQDGKYNLYKVDYNKGTLSFTTIFKGYQSDYKHVEIITDEETTTIDFKYEFQIKLNN